MVLNVFFGIIYFIIKSIRASVYSYCATFEVQREGRGSGRLFRYKETYKGNSIVSSQEVNEKALLMPNT